MKTKPSIPGTVEQALAPLPPASREALQALQEQVKQALAEERDSEALLALLAQYPPGELAWDLALLAVLSRIVHPAIPEVLARHFAPVLDKPRQKALKKAFHLLKTRGLTIPAGIIPQTETSLARRPETTPWEGLVSTIDAFGSRIIVLKGPKAGLGFNMLHALCNDREGLKDCFVLSASKKERREILDKYQQDEHGELVSVPLPYCLRLLEEAFSRRADPKSEGPATYRQVRDRLLALIDLDAAPAVEDLLPPLSEAEAARYIEESYDLCLEENFHPWLPTAEDLAPWLKKIRDIYESPLVLSDEQRNERIDLVMAQATGALFPPEERPLWSRRLLEMAYYLDRRGKPEKARLAQAAGEDLKRPRGILQGENPFLLGLVHYSVMAVAEFLKDVEEAAESAERLATPADNLIVVR